MRIHSERAWSTAMIFSGALASGTRDLAAHIDVALGEVVEEAAKIAEAHGHPETAFAIRALQVVKQE